LDIRIEEGLKKRSIIVGYEDSNVLRFFYHKLIKTLGLGNSRYTTMAFYTAAEDRLVILLDNNVDLFGDREIWHNLLNITLHELIHMSTNHNPELFTNVTGKYLRRYYMYLVNLVLRKYNVKIKVKENDVRGLVKQLVNVRVKNQYWYQRVKNSMQVWNNFFASYKLEQTVKNEIAMFILGPSFYAGEDYESILGLNEVVAMDKIFREAYRAVRLRDPKVGVHQEATTPDEVIAVLAIYNIGINEYTKLVNSIKFKDFSKEKFDGIEDK
jgi:hypothetical protein